MSNMENILHNTKQFDSFQEEFEKHLKDGKRKTFFVDDGSFVFSLALQATPLPQENESKDELYKINDINWQEECTCYGAHNVCNNTYEDYAIYNYTKDQLEKDCYLYDKYAHDTDGNLSDKLKDLFHHTPYI